MPLRLATIAPLCLGLAAACQAEPQPTGPPEPGAPSPHSALDISDLPSAWQALGRAGARPLDGESLTLTAARGERAAQACRVYPAQAGQRLHVQGRWEVAGIGEVPPGRGARLELFFLERNQHPVIKPGGRVRLAHGRSDSPAASFASLHAAPPGTALACVCAELSGVVAGSMTVHDLQVGPLQRQGDPTRPNLLLIVVDALRADALGLYGQERPTSPCLDALAAQSLVFERAWTQYTWTGPSFVSYMTSRFARSHGATRRWSEAAGAIPAFGPQAPTLAAVLRDSGYITVGLNANAYLDVLRSSALGFDRWDFQGDPAAIREAVGELRAWPHDGLPNFLYVHLMSTHDPLCPGPQAQQALGVKLDPQLLIQRNNSCLEGGLRQNAAAYEQLSEEEHRAIYQEAYLAATLDADHRVSQLLDALQTSGEAERTLVIFTSDHGELLGEHEQMGHGSRVDEPLTRVPLLLRGPGIEPGRRAEGVARLIDLAPTVLDALGLIERQPAGWQGRSLLGTREPQLAVSERQELTAYTRDGRWKLVERSHPRPQRQAFDQQADPGELKALQGEQATALQELAALAETWKAQTPIAEEGQGLVPVGEEQQAQLQQALEALGYTD